MKTAAQKIMNEKKKMQLANKCINTYKNDLMTQGCYNYDEKMIIGLFKDMTIYQLKNWIKIDEKLKSIN